MIARRVGDDPRGPLGVGELDDLVEGAAELEAAYAQGFLYAGALDPQAAAMVARDGLSGRFKRPA